MLLTIPDVDASSSSTAALLSGVLPAVALRCDRNLQENNNYGGIKEICIQ